MKQVQRIARKLFESKVIIHVIFVVLFLLLFCLPAILSGLPINIILRVIIYGVFVLSCIYAGRWSCRKFLLSNKFNLFILYASVLIIILFVIGTIGLRLLTSNRILPIVVTVLGFDILFFFIGLSLSITRTTILRQLKDANIMQQQKESELQLLRSQLSPHFLFNILNNLYGLSITQHEKIPGLLLKLSDLLRYSVYDTKEDFVPLKNELTYIENYIDLEKIRIGDRLMLDANIQRTNIETICIAPMLLIVFIENAFKHSKNTYDQNILIRMDLQIIGDTILFSVKNSCAAKISNRNTDEGSGVGLANTLKRLELLYPQKYLLEKTKMNGYYNVKLQLNFK